MTEVFSYGIAAHPADAQAESQLGELLNTYYPFVSWFVDAQGEQGIIDITCPEFHAQGGSEYGFRLKLDSIKGWDDMKRLAISAGGELLERASVDRVTGERYSEKVDRD